MPMNKNIKTFDRGIEYKDMENKLILEYQNILNDILVEENLNKINIKNLFCVIISLIQLKNGSRISEAIKAFKYFLKNPNDQYAAVVISKRKDKAERNINKPKYIVSEVFELINSLEIKILDNTENTIATHIRQFLLIKYKCNTHSLRYALINYLLSDEKENINIVANLVGHKDTRQLVRYTQKHRVNSILDKLSY